MDVSGALWFVESTLGPVDNYLVEGQISLGDWLRGDFSWCCRDFPFSSVEMQE